MKPAQREDKKRLVRKYPPAKYPKGTKVTLISSGEIGVIMMYRPQYQINKTPYKVAFSDAGSKDVRWVREDQIQPRENTDVETTPQQRIDPVRSDRVVDGDGKTPAKTESSPRESAVRPEGEEVSGATGEAPALPG
jgi:hypothetical protein